jgi:hypothetical protein
MPAVLHPGQQVTLRFADRHLADCHGAVAGQTVGTIRRHSTLGPDDHGLLVDWNQGGGEVRCWADELLPVESRV